MCMCENKFSYDRVNFIIFIIILIFTITPLSEHYVQYTTFLAVKMTHFRRKIVTLFVNFAKTQTLGTR